MDKCSVMHVWSKKPVIKLGLGRFDPSASLHCRDEWIFPAPSARFNCASFCLSFPSIACFLGNQASSVAGCLCSPLIRQCWSRGVSPNLESRHRSPVRITPFSSVSTRRRSSRRTHHRFPLSQSYPIQRGEKKTTKRGRRVWSRLRSERRCSP